MSYYKKYLKYKIKYEDLLNGGNITDPILTTHTQTSIDKKVLEWNPELKTIKDRPIEYKFLKLYELKKKGRLFNLTEYNKLKSILLKIYILTPNNLSYLTRYYFKEIHKTEFLNKRRYLMKSSTTLKDEKITTEELSLRMEFETLPEIRKYEIYLDYIRKLYNIEYELENLEYEYNKLNDEIKELTEILDKLEIELNDYLTINKKIKLKLKLKGYFDKLKILEKEENEKRKEYYYKKELLYNKNKDLKIIIEQLKLQQSLQQKIIKEMKIYYIYF